MPTPKQVRKYMARIYRYTELLHDAMIDAHNRDIIVYDRSKYVEEGPCYSIGILKERIDKTTELQLARAMKEEIKAGVK